jgi:phage I-like protein
VIATPEYVASPSDGIIARTDSNPQVNNLIQNLDLGGATTGKTSHYIKSGNFNTTMSDLYSLNPSNIKDRGNGLITGQLSDGRMVIARNFSSNRELGNPPTLEIQGKNNTIKIRYVK